MVLLQCDGECRVGGGGGVVWFGGVLKRRATLNGTITKKTGRREEEVRKGEEGES